MLFNSLEFLIFFPIVVFLYFCIPHKYRWILLLISSYIFYMWWKTEYLILILISTLIDYFAGIMLEKTIEKRKRTIFLILSLFTNLGLLFTFKYFNFFNHSLSIFFRLIGMPYNIPELNVLLPVGISFYTFQTLSYTINVYLGKQRAEKHLGKFALYVAFFPQLVAGPIERSTNLLPQFYKKFNFNYKRVTNGLQLMTWGFFKKIVIADNLSIVVNRVYNNVHNYSGIYYIIATIFFAFQIFCDFSGYSDIAIGAARVMGFNLMDNFKRPYHSKSISEFWKRWHISLSTWFKDYVYIPLGGNRVIKWRWYFNLFITFLVSGLWHGANWTFVIWGALNGFYLLFSIWTDGLRKRIVAILCLNKAPKLHKGIKVGITFSLICFSWIFFRANNVKDAIYIITHLHTGFQTLALSSFKDFIFHLQFNPLIEIIKKLKIDTFSFLIMLFAIILMEIIHFFQRRHKIRDYIARKPLVVRWLLYVSGLISIILFGYYGNVEFIYFQF